MVYALGRRRRGILGVADVRTPGGAVALAVDVEHRDVCHEPRGRSTVPVLLARLEEHAVARPDYFDRPAATLGEADALDDENGLAVWVRVPRRACARSEVHAARGQARSSHRGRHGIDVHGPG